MFGQRQPDDGGDDGAASLIKAPPDFPVHSQQPLRRQERRRKPDDGGDNGTATLIEAPSDFPVTLTSPVVGTDSAGGRVQTATPTCTSAPH